MPITAKRVRALIILDEFAGQNLGDQTAKKSGSLSLEYISTFEGLLGGRDEKYFYLG